MSGDYPPELGQRSRLWGAGSLMTTLARSLLLGLALLWLIGVVGSGYVLQRMIDGKSDDELLETGNILASFIGRSPDLTSAAVVLADAQARAASAPGHDRFAYRVVDGSGRILLRSGNAPAADVLPPLKEGFVDLDGWRVVTLADRPNARYLQVADPLSERRETLVSAVLWLTAPLAVLLAFAGFMVLRASRSLMDHVQRTATAVAERDPRALGVLPLSGVVTEMRPAVEAANRLLARVSHALEVERSFTYNSAHELRTPIAAALAQVQLMATLCEGPPELKVQAARLIESMMRLSRLSERLLALARAEGTEPLVSQWVDLAQVVRLTVDEFQYDARLQGRELVAETEATRVRGDLDAVGLALRNLVENALVHGAGGTFIRVDCRNEGRGVTLRVIDDGPGASAADLPSLTERFTRAGNVADTAAGAGLGLAIVAMLARRMRARLTLHSPPADVATGFEACIFWARPSDDAPKLR
jgi:two-component system, OmpR family, sensor kinase